MWPIRHNHHVPRIVFAGPVAVDTILEHVIRGNQLSLGELKLKCPLTTLWVKVYARAKNKVDPLLEKRSA